MKIKHKKLVASGTAVTLAGVLGVGALLQTSVSVQASSAMMPGIEEIVSDTTDSDEPFRILEIVDDKSEAEIGYYVSGQEPYIKLYEYPYEKDGKQETAHFSSLLDGLQKLPTAQLREAFAMNLKINENGEIDENGTTDIRDVSNICGDSVENNPLNKTNYQEKYFLDSGESEEEWPRVDFVDIVTGKSRTDTVSIAGSYQENASGTGDYTKEDQNYYPIRKDNNADESRTDKYRENIESFYASAEGAQAPYYLEFEEVDNAFINNALQNNKQEIIDQYDSDKGRYGYYENVYADLTEEMVNNIDADTYTFPGSNPAMPSVNEEIWSYTSTQSDAFNAGEVDDFSTVEETPASTSTTTDFGSSQDNAFSDGDFSSEEEIGDTQASASTEQSVPQSASVQTTDTTTPDVESGVSDGTQGENASEQAMLGKIADLQNQKSPSDPLIYLGENIEKYPYYQYTLVGDLKYVKDTAKTNQSLDEEKEKNGQKINRIDKDITLENGQYWYWKWNESKNDFDKLPLSIVTGLQPVSIGNVKEIDTSKITYNYYYRVKTVYFCCASKVPAEKPEDFQYQGWYYPNYPANEDVYLPVKPDEKPTHYISDEQYKLTPGKGNYDFVPGGDQIRSVQVDHMYYNKGGYINHDWFKRYVFHLSPEDSDETVRKQFKNFNIEVTTMTAEEFNKTYGNATATTSIEDTDAEAAAVTDSEGEESDTTEDSTVDETTNETTSPEDTETSDTSEVDSMVSEAGVELVSIENEISDSSASEFQDGLDVTGDTDAVQQDETVDDAISSEETPEFSDSENEDADADAFSAGDTATVANSELSKYGLVYINGSLTENAANVLVSLNVPCIINSQKADKSSELKSAFESFYNTDDSDRHYVNKNMYFFKNTSDNNENLINLHFDENFNSEDGDITDGTVSEAVSGFEEILEYIESENKYRQLGNTSGNDFSDDSQKPSSDNSSEGLLSKELSQARAIEYIINYKHKRKINTKTNINVLEIEPAKVSDTNTKKLTADTVREWLAEDDAPSIESVTACCEEKSNGNDASNIMNSDKNSIWHSAWNADSAENRYHSDTKNHILTITLAKPSSVSGFTYTPRSDGSNNGKIVSFEIRLKDKKGNLLLKENNTNPLTGQSDTSEVSYRFKDNKIYNEVKTIELEIIKSYDDTADKGMSNRCASCAHLEFFYIPESGINPTVTTMTASEYVGHIDDINSKYDMIYIGDAFDSRESLIMGNEPMLYTHVGAAQKAESQNGYKLMGMLDIDSKQSGNVKRMQSTSLYNTGEGGNFEYPGLGSFRGSGNDITEQQYSELMDFVKSGYPVILADSLVNSGTADEKIVDNSSWYYKFINEALSYPNVTTKGNINQKTLSFYTQLSKPVIEFTEGGRPLEVPRVGESSDSQNGIGYLSSEDDGLKYTFTVKNDTDTSPANSTYNCKLYFDLNFDGNLSNTEEQAKYMEITDEKGTVLTKKDGKYALRIGKTYTVSRKIPNGDNGYFKAIHWKLELVSNSNESVRTSVEGYSKRKSSVKKDINVLQIQPETDKDHPDFSTWDLSKDTTFGNLLEQVEDFKLNITTITVKQYVKQVKESQEKNSMTSDPLNNVQMVILGFGDVYENIDNSAEGGKLGAVDKLVEFIKSGKSVIFTHDTTSFVNYDYDEYQYPTNIDLKCDENPVTGEIIRINAPSFWPATIDGQYAFDKWIWKNGRKAWGYSLNTKFRSISGLDRYGITNITEHPSRGSTQTVSELLKKGQELTDKSGNVDFSYLMDKVGDVAFKINSNRSKSYMQTQGYSNNVLNGKTGETISVSKVNDGVITEYPFRLSNNINSIAKTHSQYYQLALEKDLDINNMSDGKNDIVVWYCLDGGDYSYSPRDVRNSYYFYSRGNVIYTGVGHRSVTSEEEMKLFINAMVAAANVTAVQPDVNFVTELNPAARVEKTRYYATDQTSWVDTNERNMLGKEDMDFYINIRDYNMVSTSLSEEDQKSEKMKVDFYIAGKDETNKINNVINTLTPYGDELNTVNYNREDNTFYLTGDNANNAYKFSIPDIEKYLQTESGGYKSNCVLYVKVTSTVSLYGTPTTSSTWSSIDLTQRQLFDLD